MERALGYLKRGFLVGVVALAISIIAYYAMYTLVASAKEKWYAVVFPEWAEEELVELGAHLLLVLVIYFAAVAVGLYGMSLLWRGYSEVFGKRSAPAVGSLIVASSYFVGFLDPVVAVVLWAAGVVAAFVIGIYRLWKLFGDVRLELAALLNAVGVAFGLALGLVTVVADVEVIVSLIYAYVAQTLLAIAASLLTYLALRSQ
ncbi:hypothetical protein [Pyrobaculum sp.]|uniref:hypothetical protein n=1 Tax=Pyrobaculum sp. TaxID=2004705 RepID=UPI00315FDB77